MSNKLAVLIHMQLHLQSRSVFVGLRTKPTINFRMQGLIRRSARSQQTVLIWTDTSPKSNVIHVPFDTRRSSCTTDHRTKFFASAWCLSVHNIKALIRSESCECFYILQSGIPWLLALGKLQERIVFLTRISSAITCKRLHPLNAFPQYPSGLE